MRRPNSRLMAAPPTMTGKLHAARVLLLDADRHLFARRHEQRREPDRVGLDFDGLLENHVHRHLLAEIVHGVAVVRENRVDEILADVVHVAEDGREHDGTLGRALLLLEKLLEMRDGLLHHFGGLQHERQNQFAAPEAIADVLHRRQQDLVEHFDRRPLRERFVDLRLDAVLAAAQDRTGDALGNRRVRIVGRRRRASRSRSTFSNRSIRRASASGRRLKTRSSQRSRSSASISKYGVMSLRVDERHVETGLDAVMQEDRVERGARGRLEAERNVGNSQRRERARQLALDRGDAFDRFERRGEKLGFAGREREGQRVEDQRAGRKAVLARSTMS